MAKTEDNETVFSQSLKGLVTAPEDRRSLAAAVPVDVSQVSRWLNAETTPDPFHAGPIAQHFNHPEQLVLELIAQSRGSRPPTNQQLDQRLSTLEEAVERLARLLESMSGGGR